MRFRTPIARTPRISTGNQSALTQGDHRAEGEFWRAAIAHRKFLQPGFSPRVYISRIIYTFSLLRFYPCHTCDLSEGRPELYLHQNA